MPEIDGLQPVFEKLGIEDKLPLADAWCREAGAECLADLSGYETQISEHLSLPLIKRGKLVAELQRSIADQSVRGKVVQGVPQP